MAQKVSLRSAKPLGSSLQTVAADLFIGRYRTLRSALPPVSHWHDLVLSTEARSAPERSQQYPVRRCYIYIYQNFLRIIILNKYHLYVHNKVNRRYHAPRPTSSFRGALGQQLSDLPPSPKPGHIVWRLSAVVARIRICSVVQQ